LFVLKDPSHRQLAGLGWTDQIDRDGRAGCCAQSLALFIGQIVNAPDLQPGAVFEAYIDAVHLRQLSQRGFEQRNGGTNLGSLLVSATLELVARTSNNETTPLTSLCRRPKTFELVASM
jgi:hypothetical protein